jgi:23S rRNA (adenine-N6)-dimethyltransferase
MAHPSQQHRDHFGPGGRPELGQNVLADPRVIAEITGLVERTSGPIVEFGPGDGALTIPLGRTGRTVTAVEIDPYRAKRLRERTPANVTVVTGDALRFRLPRAPHTVVGNIPFHLTTAIQRHLLSASHWQHAVLLTQWEVARRRAGVGGATLMTASWWPWYEFALHARVPARAFRPVPSVDGGILLLARLADPLIATSERKAYQDLVAGVFRGRGRDLTDILRRSGRFHCSRGNLADLLHDNQIRADSLPKDLTARQWVSLWNATDVRPAPSRRRPSRGSH